MQTVLDAFFRHVAEQPDAPCWHYKDPVTASWRTCSWREAGRRVTRCAQWLIERGIKPGDRVAIWSATRVEWTTWDLAILAIGAVTVPIYQNLPLTQAAFILNEPQCRYLVLERAFQPTLLREVERVAPHLEGVVLLEGFGETDKLPVWKNGELVMLEGANARHGKGSAHAGATEVEVRRAHLRASQLATLVYTSGTTGTPKGVELTHDNFLAEVEGLADAVPFPQHYVGLMFLPLAHIVARAMQMYQIVNGWVAAYAESLEKVAENLLTVRPHFFVSVPRLYEKVYQRVQDQLAQAPAWKRRFFQWAVRVEEQVARCRRRRQAVPWGLVWRHPIARAVFRPLRARMGGRLVCAISGGAPLAESLAKFFHAAGILILEGYGLSETTAAVTINRVGDLHFGTVGKPLKDVQLRLADDGEILVKGRVVGRGYFQRPEETAAVFDADGWFRTGDIGGFSREGFLRITDRKKDLIKTSGGKYIAPQPIEAMLKSSAYIADIIVHGDRQKYLTALLTLNREPVQQFAAREGIVESEWKGLTQHPKVRALIQQIIDGANQRLASFETIKQFTILDHDFTLEGGELTPTLKVKRQAAYERYKGVFEKMYAQESERRGG